MAAPRWNSSHVADERMLRCSHERIGWSHLLVLGVQYGSIMPLTFRLVLTFPSQNRHTPMRGSANYGIPGSNGSG